MLPRSLAGTLALAFLILFPVEGQARHHHHRHTLSYPERGSAPSLICHGTTYDNDGRTHCANGFPHFSPSPLEGRGGAGPRTHVRRGGGENNESSTSLRGGQGPIVTIPTAANPIRIASGAAERFKAVIADLVAHGFRGHVECYASHGHITNSLHYSGEACDFAQLRRNVVAPGAGIMYHASDIIAAHGLRDGCSFHDCGHVDTGRRRSARARRRIRIALRR